MLWTHVLTAIPKVLSGMQNTNRLNAPLDSAAKEISRDTSVVKKVIVEAGQQDEEGHPRRHVNMLQKQHFWVGSSGQNRRATELDYNSRVQTSDAFRWLFDRR